MPRNGRKDVRRPGFSGTAGRTDFGLQMHEPAVSHRGKNVRQAEIKVQNANAQAARRHRYRMAGTEGYILEGPAVFPQRELAFGPAIQVIEHNSWQAPLGNGPQIGDADHLGRVHWRHGFLHPKYRSSGTSFRARHYSLSRMSGVGAAFSEGCDSRRPTRGCAQQMPGETPAIDAGPAPAGDGRVIVVSNSAVGPFIARGPAQPGDEPAGS